MRMRLIRARHESPTFQNLRSKGLILQQTNRSLKKPILGHIRIKMQTISIIQRYISLISPYRPNLKTSKPKPKRPYNNLINLQASMDLKLNHFKTII